VEQAADDTFSPVSSSAEIMSSGEEEGETLRRHTSSIPRDEIEVLQSGSQTKLPSPRTLKRKQQWSFDHGKELAALCDEFAKQIKTSDVRKTAGLARSSRLINKKIQNESEKVKDFSRLKKVAFEAKGQSLRNKKELVAVHNEVKWLQKTLVEFKEKETDLHLRLHLGQDNFKLYNEKIQEKQTQGAKRHAKQKKAKAKKKAAAAKKKAVQSRT
jgi:hypothetical protein